MVLCRAGDLRTTHELGEQLLRLAQSLQDPTLLMDAYWSTGVISVYFGNFVSARARLEQGIALYDPQHHYSHAFLYGQDPGVFCFSYAAWTLWFLGYPDQALKKIHEALVFAREWSHPHSLAIILNHVAWLHHHRREENGAKEQAEAAIVLSTEHGFAQRVAMGTVLRGWALAEQGQGEEGIAQIRQGLTAYGVTGAELMRPYFLALLAEAYSRVSQITAGLTALAEALAIVERTGECTYEAELYRLKGELTLQSQIASRKLHVAEAEACFLTAIEIARKQSAKSLELRAVMSLARLWQQQGKKAEARKLVADIYDWFTEGFDTIDLKEAKALLDALESREGERQEGKDSPRRRGSVKKTKKEPKPQRSAAIRPEVGAPVLGVGGDRAPALTLPDKPSLAVLPFANMSSDPEQEYFSDGMTDTLITDLSKLSGLFVIARNSTFIYKGKTVKLQQVSQELGVRYVVEGSVQKADTRVRIIAQLVNATTGHHLWAERYDRELKDIFALQDEITQKIVAALRVEVAEAELARVRRIPTNNLTAYDSCLRGQELYRRFTKEANAQARPLFERAIALDPQYADAYVALGWTYVRERLLHWSQAPQTRERAVELAQRALALDDSLPLAHGILSYVYLGDQQLDQALTEAERAIALDPNSADSYVLRAQMLNIAGRPAAALESIEQAMRLNPYYPDTYVFQLGFTYRQMGRSLEAIAALKEVLSRNPSFFTAYTELAFSYLQAWDSQVSQDPQILEQALAIVQKALALNDAFPWTHMVLGYIYLAKKQPAQALAEAERAIALDPSSADTHADLAEMLAYLGRPERAVQAAEQAMRLSPQPPGWYSHGLGIAYRLLGRLEEAVAAQKHDLSQNPYLLSTYRELAVSYSELGREEEARAAVAAILQLYPHYSLDGVRQRLPFTDPAEVERTLTALRKAGLK